MKAVNLIPSEQRGGGGSVGAGRSEGAAYGVLVLLAAIAVMAVLYGKAHRDVESNTSKVAKVSAEASRAQAQASQLAPYTSFAALRQQREQAVASLVDSRFDWAHAFHEFGRVLTGQTMISSLNGSIAAGGAATATTTGASASAATSTVASATPAGSIPVFSLTGCATSQQAVAQMLERLRLIDGVSTVTLQSSTKGGGTGSGSTSGCPANGPSFSVTVAFQALPAAAASAAAVKPAGASTVSSTAPSAVGTQTTVSSGGHNG
jgi:Tfp pilus assembly protein PilN